MSCSRMNGIPALYYNVIREHEDMYILLYFINISIKYSCTVSNRMKNLHNSKHYIKYVKEVYTIDAKML